ncbi:unnamed protein product [Eruca vesicaria subsp. sativa]|uniref:Uncharacterized protein n=1 Tax=Eruca vesicaria subsp. sativa TaxID=29727 RepID=A0ABC8K0D6_ERUVS|nr:unnamed protein product [Eruca vesicaria subsp. sativa]
MKKLCVIFESLVNPKNLGIADDVSLCTACDSEVHSANPLARSHQRVPVLPITAGNSCSSLVTTHQTSMTDPEKSLVLVQEDAKETTSLLFPKHSDNHNNNYNNNYNNNNKNNELLFNDDYPDLADYSSSMDYKFAGQYNKHKCGSGSAKLQVGFLLLRPISFIPEACI